MTQRILDLLPIRDIGAFAHVDKHAHDHAKEVLKKRARTYGCETTDDLKCLFKIITHLAKKNSSLPLAPYGPDDFDTTMSKYIRNKTEINAHIKKDATTTLMGVCKKIEEAEEETIKCLIKLGADIHAQDEYGSTPLHYATRFNREEIVSLLLKYGANPNTKNIYNETPLHYAVFDKNNSKVKKLIHKGAHPHAQDNHGDTPLHSAMRMGNWSIIFALLSDENMNIRNNEEEKPSYGRPTDFSSLKNLLCLTQ